MFALVKFNDESHFIYHMRNVKVKNEKSCIIKHKGCKYEAQLVASNDTREHLKILQAELEEQPKKQKPRIIAIDKFSAVDLTRYSGLRRSDKLSPAQENSSLDKSIDESLDESKSSYATGTIIDETPDSIDTTDNRDETFTLVKSGALLNETHVLECSILQGTFVDNITSNDFEASPSERSNLQTSDIDSSRYLYDSLLKDGNALFPFGELLNSTPENFRISEPADLSGDDVAVHADIGDPGDTDNIEDNDPDYDPQHENTSDSPSDAESEINQTYNQSPNKNLSSNSHNISNGLNVSIAKNLPGSSRCNDEDLEVEKSHGRSGDKKYNFCLYCHKKQKKIARHLELKHNNEEDVKKFIHLPKSSKERRQIIGVIRKQGNFLFNTQTTFNDGELIVSRRPCTKFTRSASDFRACANCKAFFSKNSLRMHYAKCTGRQNKKTRTVTVMSKQVVARVHSRASDTVLNLIFPPLREDHVVRAIRYDELLIVYANKMGEKYQEARDYEMIRQRIRLLGRFLITMRKLNKDITDLTSVFDPKFCDDAVTAITIEAKLVPSCRNSATPAVASSLGTLLKLLGSILITESIKKHDDVKKKHTKDFLKLLTQELALNVNRRVTEFQAQQQRRKKVELPSMEDVKILCRYLEEKRSAAYQDLKSNFSEASWTTLAETTLTSLQLFNRRRAGEIERALIEDFKNHQSLDENTDEIYNTLSKESQSVAKRYVRFVIRGKLNRTVPVLLSTELLQCIELLLRHRKNMKISEKNPYIFDSKGEIKSKYKHLRACALLRKFSTESGATHPERLRGTKLRKHIATMCVSLNLKEHQITDLANYMGHAEKIHKDIYRQPVVNREILGISKLLEVAQGVNEEDDDEADDTDEENEQPEYDDQENFNYFNEENQRPESNSSENSKIFKTPNQKNIGSTATKTRLSSQHCSTRRTPWNDAEKQKVLELFGEDLKNKKLPSLKAIHIAIVENPCLQNRTSPQIKTWLHNQTRPETTKRKLCEQL